MDHLQFRTNLCEALTMNWRGSAYNTGGARNSCVAVNTNMATVCVVPQ